MISSLADDLIIEIFSFLKLNDLLMNIPLVCEEWNRLSLNPRIYEIFHPERKNIPFEEYGGIRKYFSLRLDNSSWGFRVESQIDTNYTFGQPGKNFIGLLGLGENRCVRIIETSHDQFSVYFSNNYKDVGIKHNRIENYFSETPTHKKIDLGGAGVARFDSYRTILSCACSDGCVRIVDAKTNKVLRKFGKFGTKPGDKPYNWDHRSCCQTCFTDSGKMVFGCGITHSVKLFDVETGKTIHDIQGTNELEYHSIASSKYISDVFAVGCTKNVIEIWNTPQNNNSGYKPLSKLIIPNNQTIYPHRAIQFVGDYFLIVATEAGGYERKHNIHLFDLRKMSDSVPDKIFSTYSGDNRGNTRSIYIDDHCSKGISVDVYGSISLWSHIGGSEFQCLKNGIRLPFASGCNDVHLAGNGRVFAISYANPQSDWFGNSAVIYDGRIGKRKTSVEENNKGGSKCSIQ